MSIRIIQGDCRDVLRTLPDESVHCVVTSPPYFGLRDYGNAAQIGLEPTPDAMEAEMVAVFADVRRVLRPDGTVWLNLGDSYCSIGHKKSGSGYGTTGLAGGKAQEHTPLRRENNVPGLKHKDLIGIPWRVAFALQADGWWLRQDIIWSKPNPMPESVTDRCTKAHEYIFMLTKSARYYYDADAIAEPAIYAGLTGQDDSGFKDAKKFDGKHATTPRNDGERWNENGGKGFKQRGHSRRHAGFNDRWDQMERAEQCSGTRNKRSVWSVATKPFSEAHFATFPPDLIEPCIKAGCPIGGTVLDPFFGAGTTGLVADRLGRDCIGIELNPEYAEIARKRISGDCPMFSEVA